MSILREKFKNVNFGPQNVTLTGPHFGHNIYMDRIFLRSPKQLISTTFYGLPLGTISKMLNLLPHFKHNTNFSQKTASFTFMCLWNPNLIKKTEKSNDQSLVSGITEGRTKLNWQDPQAEPRAQKLNFSWYPTNFPLTEVLEEEAIALLADKRLFK